MDGLLELPLIADAAADAGAIAADGGIVGGESAGLLGDWGLGSVTIGQALTGAGLGLAGASMIQSGQDQLAADKYNSGLQKQQAALLQSQAQSQALLQGQANTRTYGDIAASYGAAGVDPNQGSPLSVMADQAAQGELARQMYLWRGQAGAGAAYGQANLDVLQGMNAASSGQIMGGATLLTGGARLFGQGIS